jgi:glycosyltransferase involved in cell wall biosynthesis
MANSNILCLFFTLNTSLDMWVKTGLFDREKLIYEEYINKNIFTTIFWLTYGVDDKKVAQDLYDMGRLNKNIKIIPMPTIFKGLVGVVAYSLLIPFLRRKYLLNSDIYKTNQMLGSWSFVIAKILYKRPSLLRSGYTLSLNLGADASRWKIHVYKMIEFLAYKNCTYATVTSERDREYISKRFPLIKILVVKNYIDTKIFKPDNTNKYNNRIIFVGRLNEQKNLYELIDSLSGTGLILDIYGNGELKKELIKYVKKGGFKVNFMGVFPNSKMPNILNKYRYYTLPSLYEGMPKTLLEAMACGLVCIGTNVSGIKEVLIDGFNGYVSDTVKSSDLSVAINKALCSKKGMIEIQAVRSIHDFHSLDVIFDKELSIIKNILKQ